MCLFLSPLSNCHHSLPKHTRLIPNFSILTNLGAHGAAISAGIAARDSFLTILGHTTAKQIPTLGFLPLFYPLTRCMCDYCPSPAPEQAKFSCNKPKTRTKNPGIIPCWKKKKKSANFQTPFSTQRQLVFMGRMIRGGINAHLWFAESSQTSNAAHAWHMAPKYLHPARSRGN